MALKDDIEQFAAQASALARQTVQAGRKSGAIADFPNQADRIAVEQAIRTRVAVPPSLTQVSDKIAEALCTLAYERALERDKNSG